MTPEALQRMPSDRCLDQIGLVFLEGLEVCFLGVQGVFFLRYKIHAYRCIYNICIHRCIDA